MRRIFYITLLLLAIIANPTWAQDRIPTTIKLTPIADVNPVKTQHTMVATVLDQFGKPLPGRRVEWILSRGPKCVGDIVEHDDMGAMIGGTKEPVKKIDNHYTISYTNKRPVLLTKGTPNTDDDERLGVGQTWLTITSAVEGETHVIAFCPSIRNADKHKVFAIKYWIDAKIDWPKNAINKVNTPHVFKFKLTKASTKAPMPGYLVKWKLLKDKNAPAHLGDTVGTYVTETETNEDGTAQVTLNQDKPVAGFNKVEITLSKPTGELLAKRSVTKQWIAPQLEVEKKGPARGILGEKVPYTIRYGNPGEAEAQGVVLKDTLPSQLEFVSATPAPSNVDGNVLTWNVGILAKGEYKTIRLVTKAISHKPKTAINTVALTSKEAPPQTGTAVTEILAPNVYIIKEGPSMVRKGQKANYTLTVKNNGTGPATNVVVRDKIPAGMKYKTRVNGMTLRWKLGTIPAQGKKSIRYTLDTPKVGTFDNTAKVYMGRKHEVRHKTELRTRVVAPVLKITKDAPRLTILHRAITCTITITNEGDAPARNLKIIDTLPRLLDYIRSTPRGVYRKGKKDTLSTVTWKIPEIKANSKVVIKLMARAKLTGRCRNGVKLISNDPELPVIPTKEAFANIKIKGIPAVHISSYDTEDPCEVGRQTIYIIECMNEGTSPCTIMKLHNRIPKEMEYVGAKGPTPHTHKDGLVIFEPVPIVQPGEKLTYTIICRAVRPGSAKNTATLRYKQFDVPIIDEEGTSIYKP